jgi:hypothetical protein
MKSRGKEKIDWHKRWLKTANKRLLDHPAHAAGFKPNSLCRWS